MNDNVLNVIETVAAGKTSAGALLASEGAATASRRKSPLYNQKKSPTVGFDLDQSDEQQLEALAKQIGLNNGASLSRHLARRALDMPPELVKQFLVGESLLEIEAKVKAENQKRVAKTTKKKPTDDDVVKIVA